MSIIQDFQEGNNPKNKDNLKVPNIKTPLPQLQPQSVEQQLGQTPLTSTTNIVPPNKQLPVLPNNSPDNYYSETPISQTDNVDPAPTAGESITTETNTESDTTSSPSTNNSQSTPPTTSTFNLPGEIQPTSAPVLSGETYGSVDSAVSKDYREELIRQGKINQAVVDENELTNNYIPTLYIPTPNYSSQWKAGYSRISNFANSVSTAANIQALPQTRTDPRQYRPDSTKPLGANSSYYNQPNNTYGPVDTRQLLPGTNVGNNPFLYFINLLGSVPMGGAAEVKKNIDNGLKSIPLIGNALYNLNNLPNWTVRQLFNYTPTNVNDLKPKNAADLAGQTGNIINSASGGLPGLVGGIVNALAMKTAENAIKGNRPNYSPTANGLLDPDLKYKGNYLLDVFKGAGYSFSDYEYNTQGVKNPIGLKAGRDPGNAGIEYTNPLTYVGLLLDVGMPDATDAIKPIYSLAKKMGIIKAPSKVPIKAPEKIVQAPKPEPKPYTPIPPESALVKVTPLNIPKKVNPPSPINPTLITPYRGPTPSPLKVPNIPINKTFNLGEAKANEAMSILNSARASLNNNKPLETAQKLREFGNSYKGYGLQADARNIIGLIRNGEYSKAREALNSLNASIDQYSIRTPKLASNSVEVSTKLNEVSVSLNSNNISGALTAIQGIPESGKLARFLKKGDIQASKVELNKLTTQINEAQRITQEADGVITIDVTPIGSSVVPNKPTKVLLINSEGTLVKRTTELVPEVEAIKLIIGRDVEVPVIKLNDLGRLKEVVNELPPSPVKGLLPESNVTTSAVEGVVNKTPLQNVVDDLETKALTPTSVETKAPSPAPELVSPSIPLKVEKEADLVRETSELIRLQNKPNIRPAKIEAQKDVVETLKKEVETISNTPEPKTKVLPAIALKGELTVSEAAKLLSNNIPGTQIGEEVVKQAKRTKDQVLALMRVVPAPDGKPIISSAYRGILKDKVRIQRWTDVKKILEARGIQDPVYYRLFSENGAPIDIAALSDPNFRIVVDPPKAYKAQKEVVVDNSRYASVIEGGDTVLTQKSTQTINTSVKQSFLPGYEKPRIKAKASNNKINYLTDNKAKGELKRVLVSEIDNAWKEKKIGADGIGSVKKKYEEALLKIANTDEPVTIPQISVGSDGQVKFLKGANEFAVLRDSGVTEIPVMMTGTGYWKGTELNKTRAINELKREQKRLQKALNSTDDPAKVEDILARLEEITDQLNNPDVKNPAVLKELQNEIIPDNQIGKSQPVVEATAIKLEAERDLEEISDVVNKLEYELGQQELALSESVRIIENTADIGRKSISEADIISPQVIEDIATNYNSKEIVLEAIKNIEPRDKKGLNNLIKRAQELFKTKAGDDAALLDNFNEELDSTLRPLREAIDSLREGEKLDVFKYDEVIDSLADSPINSKPFYHGSSVVNWSPNYDPISTGSNAEWGQGLYLSTDPERASHFAKATVGENLPYIEDRNFGTPKVYELKPNLDNVIDVNEPASKTVKKLFVNSLQSVVGKGTEASKRFVQIVKRNTDTITVSELYGAIERALVKSGDNSEATLSNVKRQVNYSLREAGFDGLSDGNTLNVLDTSKVQVINTQALDNVDEIGSAIARHNADSMTALDNPNIPSAQVNHMESGVRLQSQLREDTINKLKEARQKQVEAISNLDEADTELTELAQREKEVNRLQQLEKDQKEMERLDRELSKPNDNPCEF
ncbi:MULTISPECIES: hypothetical protein [Calothrix]|uniref:Uncharacterized protein n=2 Tax=Calothrix TaxID=1186 RepID=A0ABR8AK16_9CYAN|nr:MULTISPECIES: hypothetical protein [Calothrix]MBD2200149.1 hypothetical protein [Calothrix parietina FACHB-288]MBD2229141.1 hypothetical protein [Calothrix anomala FACHB-343]